MRKINICQVVNNLDSGGLEKVVISLLNNLDPARFNLSIICLDGEGALFSQIDTSRVRPLILEKAGVNLLVVSVSPRSLLQIRRFIRENQIDIIHAHNWGPLTYTGFATLLQRERPRIVYTEHNQINRATPWQTAKFDLYIQNADKVVVVSRDLKRFFEEKLHLQSDVEVIYNGISGERYKLEEDPEFRRALPVEADDFICGTAVVLSEQKGLSYLIETAKIVCAQEPKIKFLLAGDGPLRAQLEAQAVDAGLGDSFTFLGYRSDIPLLVSCFDIYVLSSLWEGLPLCLIEALAIGKPVVATRVGGNPELVEEGVNGFIVPPRDPQALADRILTIYQDEGLRTSMRQTNVIKFKEQFSLETMIRQYSDLYRSLV